LPVTVLIVAGLAASGMAQDGGQSTQLIEQTFAKFARGWLGNLSPETPLSGNGVRFLGLEAPDQPQGSPDQPKGAPDQPEQFTYRDHDGDFAIQMRPTGDTASPFVGILSYTENVYVCRGPTRDDCELVESSPITEIFPFRDGRWQY